MIRSPDRPRGRIAISALAAHERALLDAATSTFVQHGYEGASIDRLARDARISTKTIYARYGGKAGLFQAVMARMSADVLAPFRSLTASADPPEIVLPAYGHGLLALTLAPDALALQRAVSAEAMRFPAFAEAFYANGPAQGIAILAAYLAGQHASGRLRVPDPGQAAEHFVGLVQGETLRRAVLNLEPDPAPAVLAAKVNAAVAAFLRAYGPG